MPKMAFSAGEHKHGAGFVHRLDDFLVAHLADRRALGITVAYGGHIGQLDRAATAQLDLPLAERVGILAVAQHRHRLARAADKALMVITDEPTSMTDAYAFIKVLRGYAPNVEPVICINQAESRAAGQRTYEAIARACQTFLGFRPHLAGTVMRDPKVRDAIRCQKTLISTDQQAQPIQDAIAISQMLIGARQGVDIGY